MRKILLTGMVLFAICLSGLTQTVSISGNHFTVNGQQIWFNGINTPWDLWDDFGNPSFDPAWWRSEFQDYVTEHINLARVWIHCDGYYSPTTNTDGSVTGASAQFWANMDTLIAISKRNKVYIMPCLWSFDLVKNTYSTYQKYRNLIASQANVQSYIDNFLIPLVQRYNNDPYILGWEICNEPEWMFENAEDGPQTVANVQRLIAMCAAAIHKNSNALVTTGSAAVKWNSDLYAGTGDNAGNVWSNTALQSVYNDPDAYLDFWSFHWYSWVTEWFSSPYQQTTAYYQLDDKPVLIGETGGAQCDAYICMDMTQYYESAYINGYDGVCAWKQVTGVPTFVSDATNAFYNNHPLLVYPGSEPAVSVTGVSIPATAAIDGLGNTTTLTATVSPSTATDKTVHWASSDPTIATVDVVGIVTAIKAGTATITATTVDGQKTASCVVTVTGQCTPTAITPYTQINGGTWSQTTVANATAGDNVSFGPQPIGGTWGWTGPNGFTASTRQIDLTNVQSSNAGNYVASYTNPGGCTTTSTFTLYVAGGTISVTGVTVSPTSATITGIGNTTNLTATVSPSNASNQGVTWSSSNTNIATVNSSGAVTAVAAGSATITVTTNDGGHTATSAITVNTSSVAVTGVTVSPTSATITGISNTTTLTATVSPSNASNKSVTWSSSNTGVATVNSSGVVTAVSAGSATITVTTNDGGHTATSAITVNSGGTPCSNPVAITIPFSFDGAGEYCWSTTQAMAYINSWNMQLLEINGVDYTNVWSNNLPAAVNGAWTIHYIGPYPWSHFEAPQAKSAVTPLAGNGTDVLMYPNPFTTSINLHISQPKLVNTILIIDQTGRVVEKFGKSQISNNIEIGSDFASGIYIIKVVTNERSTSYKVIKK